MHSCVIEKIELHSAHNMETENNATQNKTSTHSSCYNDLAVRKILVLIKVGLKVETKNYAKNSFQSMEERNMHICVMHRRDLPNPVNSEVLEDSESTDGTELQSYTVQHWASEINIK